MERSDILAPLLVYVYLRTRTASALGNPFRYYLDLRSVFGVVDTPVRHHAKPSNNVWSPLTNWGFGKFHALELIIITRIKSAVMFKHKTFELPGSNRYWLAGFGFLEWVAFCHNNLVSLRLRLLTVINKLRIKIII